jgi:TonB family protein
MICFSKYCSVWASAQAGARVLLIALILTLSLTASAQEATQPNPAPTSFHAAAAPQAKPVPSVAEGNSTSEDVKNGGITEAELKQMLIGKDLYLRGGYLENALSFNEHGVLIGHSPRGSYTLCAVEIDRVHLSKAKAELEGARYGLHFLGELPYEDPGKAADRVRITPERKRLKITIDREVVVKPKKDKGGKETDEKEKKHKFWKRARAEEEESDADQPQADSAPANLSQDENSTVSAEEKPADSKSVTKTTSPAHAAKVLNEALDQIFAPGLDARMMAAMPDFWKLYYQAASARTDYQPSDPTILRQTSVDKKALLISSFEPDSNQYAQDNGVAGMALYHVVVGADGRPGEVAVARPIGFGLDENAVAAIRKAKFEPAMKDGKPAPVFLDLVVQFHIYSQRTAVVAAPGAQERPASPVLPGPYSVQHP